MLEKCHTTCSVFREKEGRKEGDGMVLFWPKKNEMTLVLH
jgi:hypothetical protein